MQICNQWVTADGHKLGLDWTPFGFEKRRLGQGSAGHLKPTATGSLVPSPILTHSARTTTFHPVPAFPWPSIVFDRGREYDAKAKSVTASRISCVLQRISRPTSHNTIVMLRKPQI